MTGTLGNRFTYHAPKGNQTDRYESIRFEAFQFAEQLVEYCPPSAELTHAINMIDQAVMWANASIARNE